MDSRFSKVLGLVSGLIGAVIGGLAEYVLTGGSSTWTPLFAGVIGALTGGLVWFFFLTPTKEPQIKKSPAELMDIVSAGLTSIEAASLVKPYIGSTIKFSGTVRDVMEVRGIFLWFLVRPGVFIEVGEGRKVIALFRWFWASKVRRLRVGDQVSVYGTITEVGRYDLWISGSRLRE